MSCATKKGIELHKNVNDGVKQVKRRLMLQLKQDRFHHLLNKSGAASGVESC